MCALYQLVILSAMLLRGKLMGLVDEPILVFILHAPALPQTVVNISVVQQGQRRIAQCSTNMAQSIEHLAAANLSLCNRVIVFDEHGTVIYSNVQVRCCGAWI